MHRSRNEHLSESHIVEQHLQNRARLHEARRRQGEAGGVIGSFLAKIELRRAYRAFEDSGEHVGMVQQVREYVESGPLVDMPNPDLSETELYGLDPRNPQDIEERRQITNLSNIPEAVNYSRDAFDFGGTPKS